MALNLSAFSNKKKYESKLNLSAFGGSSGSSAVVDKPVFDLRTNMGGGLTQTSTPSMITSNPWKQFNYAAFAEPVKIRAPFDKTESTLPYGGLATKIVGEVVNRTLEWIPRTVVQGIANVNATKGKETTLPFNASRLGLGEGRKVLTTGENYYKDPGVQQWLADPKISNLPSAVKGAMMTIGSDIIDAFAAGGMVKSISEAVIKNVAVPNAEHITAWKGLGMPSSIEEAKTTARGLLLDLSTETKGFTTGGKETASTINNFMSVIEKQGIPKIPNIISQGARRFAQILNIDVNEISNIIRNGEIQAPFMGKRLPGSAIVGEPQPALGMSIQPEKPVGFGESGKSLEVLKAEAVAKGLPELPKLSTGGVAGVRGLAKVGLAPEKPTMITKSEPALLNKQIRDEARGTKIGFKLGQQEARNILLDKFRTTITNIDNVKSEIVNYVKDNIPTSDRGVFLNMVKDAKTQMDLTKAFTRIDTKANEIQVKQAITTLKNTVAKTSESNAVSADYRNKIKDVLDSYELQGHQQATIDKLKATQDFINRQASIGEEVEIPQRILDRLKILSRTPKDQLTLQQIQGLQSEVELLAKLGETKWSTKQALYDNEKELRKNQLLDSATSINSKQVKNIGLEKDPSKYAQLYFKARNYLQKTRVGLTPIEGLADITGMNPMKDVLDNDFGNYLTDNDKNIQGWYELTKDFDESNFKRIGAYAISEQTGGVERLANNGITPEQVANLNLTPEEMKAYKYVRDVFDKEFPAVKKYTLDVYNKDVGEVKNYVSFIADDEAMNGLELYDRFGNQPEFPTRTKTTEQGFTKERANLAGYKVELNIDKIFRRHTDDVSYMLNMGRDIKQYFEIVNSPEMKAKLGDVGSLAWLQYLDLMARKGGSEGARRIAALDILRKNLSAGVLAFRISSAMVQFTSFADTMGTIGAEWAMKGASNISLSKDWRNFVMDNFPEVKKAVGDDVAFREFGDGFLAKTAMVGLKPLQALDGLMRATAVAGHYEKLLAEKGLTMDFANPNKELIQEATKSMRQSQGSSFFKDQPLSITTNFGLAENKSLNKFILTFQSFMLNRWDNLQRQIWRLGIKEKNYAKASMSFLWMVIVAAAMEEGIRRGVKYGIGKATELVTGKEDTTPQGTVLGNMALNVVQTIPIMGSIASSMTYSSNPVPVINTYEQAQTGASGVWNGKELQTKIRGGISFLGAAGSLSGVPGSSQISQLIKGLVPPVNAKSSKSSGLPQLPKLPSLPKLPKLPKI